MFFAFSVPQTTNATNGSIKDADDFTFNEIHQMLLDYFEANNIDLEVGSDEFIEYLLLQQLENADETLLNHPHYDLIDYYIGEYLYQLGQELGEDPQPLPNTLLDMNMSIGELKREIDLRNLAEEEFERELEELKLSEPESTIMSSYNRAKVADYAKKYATKRNPKSH